MEKLKNNYFKIYIIILAIGSLQIFVLHNYHNNLQAFILFNFALIFGVLLGYLSERFSVAGTYFNKLGITTKRSKNAVVFKKWDEVTIDTKIDLSYFKLSYLNFSNQGKKHSVLMCWTSEDSLISLTKKYVPKTHPLYLKVKEYAVNRKLEF